ncbi:MAG: cysteine desulfurase [Sphingobacteriales bacterium]|nr:MAG: cysteine desulfurase [Sphingobacteriales bacterium]
MSINIDHNQGPDVQWLQELANNFFKSIPGSATESSSPTQTKALQQDSLGDINVNDISTPPTSIPDPHFAGAKTPVSLGGAGITPGSINAVNAIDLKNQEQPVDASTLTGSGKNPNSVAGSGISPTAHQQGNGVDLQNPQTELPDPHFAGSGKNPQSAGGKGISPSVKYAEQYDHLPYTDQSDLIPDIKKILAAIPFFNSVEQLPLNYSNASGASYYFLNEKEFAPVTKAAVSNEHKSTGITGLAKPPFDVNLVKKDFPILQERVNGRPLIWLDNAATTQKPQSVIDRISYFYQHENSNIHRAAHELAARATDAYEAAREKVRVFLNAASVNELVFVRGTTEAINLVAKSYGEQFLKAGDEVIVSHLEHHANIVPWQQLAQKNGIKLRVIPVDDDGQVLLDEYQKLLNPKTKLVSFTQVSNALGTITPAKQIIDLAHDAGAKVLLDGAQSVSHLRVNVQYLNPDFFVFSGHKVFGPTGIGVLYGKEELLNEIQPWQGGGNMIKDVTFEHTQFHNAPSRFEAGTGNIADAVGLGAALDYVNKLGIDNIHLYEHQLLLYATKLMKEVPGLRLVGTATDKASVLSFTLKGFSNDEVGKALNKEGIAVRTGHHCAQPILRRFGLESTVRPSLAFYNTCADINTLVSVLHKLKRQ